MCWRINFVLFLFTLIIVILFNNVFSNALFFDASINQVLAKQDRVRVIVLVKEPTEIYKDFKFNVKQLKSLRKSLQDRVISKINKRNVKYRFSIINGFSAFLNASEIFILKQNPFVKAIIKSKVYKVVLQDSVPLINATQTWKIKVNRINVTGKDYAVCVIDTGVNYSHPDLGGCFGNNNQSSNCKIIGGWDYCADDSTCNTTQDNDPMDVNGHGTHITGIIAANGSIKGVAPDAKIIAIKVMNATGATWDDVIIEGISWCINNASKFNITVISMSLGSDNVYSNYCDNDPTVNPTLVTLINNAVANNISVVIASGNSGSTVGISQPACIYNATAVAATDKTDVMASFSNRNALVDLVAPGVNINSTWLTGYYVASGTSMATPHVSAAFLLLRQYKELEKDIILTPEQIQDALNQTGKLIYDSESGLNYSRINVYAAILSLDETPPNITFVQPTPSNNSVLNKTYMEINVSVKDLQFSNLTVWFYNQTSLINKTTSLANNFFINFTNLSKGIYFFNVTAYDLKNNFGVSETRKVAIDPYAPNITLVAPFNNTISSNKTQIFTCNLSDISQLKNITLYIWNETSLLVINSTNISGNMNQSSWQLNLDWGKYIWNCKGCDSFDNCGFSSFNFSLSIVRVKTQLKSPINGTSTNKYLINFSCNASTSQGSELTNITFYLWNQTNLIYNETNQISGLTNETSFQINSTQLNLEEGIYKWNCLAENNLSEYAYASDNFTLIYDLTSPKLNPLSPKNQTWYNRLEFNLTAIDNLSSIDKCWFELNSTNESMNGSMNKINETYFSYVNSSIAESIGFDYKIIFYCNDSAGNINKSLTLFFGIDKTKPNITLIEPFNNYQINSSQATINFTFNVTDKLNLSWCKLIITGTSSSITLNQSKIVNGTNWIQKTLGEGTYYWKINCSDLARNLGSSESWSLSLQAPTSGGGDSGAGETVQNESQITETKIENPYWNKEIDLKKEVPLWIEINEPNIPIIQLFLNLNQDARVNLKIVTFLFYLPSDLQKLEKPVYLYLKIETNLKKEQIKNAKMKFRVAKNWLEKNSIDANWVVLMKYADGWKELKTSLIKEETDWVYYIVYLDSFSYFAITYEPISCPNCTSWGQCINGTQVRTCYKYNETLKECKAFNETKSCQIEKEKIEIKEKKEKVEKGLLKSLLIGLIIAITFFWLIIYIIYIYKKKKKKNLKKRKLKVKKVKKVKK